MTQTWEGTIVIESAQTLPIAVEIINQDQLIPKIVDEGVSRLFLSLSEGPKNHNDLTYRRRSPGSHLLIEIGRVEEENKLSTEVQKSDCKSKFWTVFCFDACF